MPKWIDLRDTTTNGKLKVAHENGNTYLFIVGLSEVTARYKKAIEVLGFRPSQSGRYLARALSPGEKIKPDQFRPVWPNAALVEMPQDSFVLKLRATPTPQGAPTEEERKVTIDSSGMRRLGRNADGEVVYQAVYGRAIGRPNGTFIFESRTLRPEMFLKMDANDPDSVAMCCDGFIQSMILGEVQHSDDFAAFVGAIYNTTSPSREQSATAFASIEAAVARYLSNSYDNAQDAYGDSVRLYELMPPCPEIDRGKGAMPMPLSVIAQRLLGDTNDKRVLYPNAFDGAAFTFLSAGTKVEACRGIKDLSINSKGLSQPDSVVWHNEFKPADHKEMDAVFFNSDPGIVSMGSRSDYIDALRVAGSLKAGGRGVFVMAGDSSIGSMGAISDESRSFYRVLSERYDIEDAFELGAELCQGVGTGHSLRVVSFRNRPAPSDAPVLIEFPVLHSWDEVKSRVDETIINIELKEAETQSIDVEGAVRENEYQRPYIAFSKVGEARTMVPKNLQAPLQAALANLEHLHGPVDRFVEKQLGFGENTLGERFSPEQVDSVGLMVNRFQQGRGFILGDDTGIGKGRQLAALAVWAQKQGKKVVFITDRANLFSDLARDLRDIDEWGRFNPFVMNSDGHIIDMFSPDGAVLAKGTPPAVMSNLIREETPLANIGHNMLFATYSQVANAESLKTKWFLEEVQGAMLIVDESHIAAGSDSNISWVIADACGRAADVCFSSATWAKSAKNLHIYSRALPESINIDSLTSAIKSGGESFVEIFSSMMARDGAMIRREHDLSRIDFSVEIDTGRLQRNMEWSDKVSEVLGQMAYVGGEVNKLLMRSNSETLKALRAARNAGVTLRTGKIFRSNFAAGSAAYVTMRRFLAALNAEHSADLALKASMDNKKPVIVFEDTSETYVEQIVRELSTPVPGENPIRPELIPAPTIKTLLMNVMKRLGVVAVREAKEKDLHEGETEVERQRRVNLVRAERRLQRQAEALQAAGRPVPGDLAAPGQPVAQRLMNIDEFDDGSEAGGAQAEQPVRPATDLQSQDDGVDIDDILSIQHEEDETLISIEGDANLDPVLANVYREGIQKIVELIRALPDIPIIPADIIRNRLKAAGLRVGEISGRKYYLDAENLSPVDPEVDAHRTRANATVPTFDGNTLWRLVPRAKTKQAVNSTVRAFNSGALDALVLNRSAATGISLHASPRFADIRRRTLVESQIPENPTDRVQLYGRVNRYDQVISPEIQIATTGIYGERRQLIMQNRKLAEMSANVRSSPEHAAEIKEVRDLLNPIGEEVCQQFLLDNPGILSRIGVDYKSVEDGRVNCSHVLTSRVVLLRTVDQQRVYEELYAMYDEAVLRHELAGTSPLRTKERDWRAKTLSQNLMMGAESTGFLSAFSGPVYLKKIAWQEIDRSFSTEQVKEMVRQGRQRLVDTGKATLEGPSPSGMPRIAIAALANKTIKQIEAIARVGLIGTQFRNVEEALAVPFNQTNPVKRAWNRKIWLENNLEKILPGAYVQIPPYAINKDREGWSHFGVVVGLKPPPDGRESQLSNWRVEIAVPYTDKILSLTLASVIDAGNVSLAAPLSRRYGANVAALRDEAEDDAEQDTEASEEGGAGAPQASAEGDETTTVEQYGSMQVVVRDVFALGPPAEDEPEVLKTMRRNNTEILSRFGDDPAPHKYEMSAYTLEGNMYMAAEWASATKAGKPMIYTNDKGQRVRAVVLDSSMRFNLAQYLPMRLSSTRQIQTFLERLVDGLENGTFDRREVLREGQVIEFHTTFKGSIGQGRAGGDFFTIVPGNRIALTVDKKGMTRIGNSLRAVQRRLIEESVKESVANGGPEFNLRRIAQHPDYITVSKEDATVRGAKTRRLFLKCETPEKLKRAIRVMSEGAGLEFYLSPMSVAGRLAKEVINQTYEAEVQDARERFERNNPESAQRLRQIEAEILAARSVNSDSTQEAQNLLLQAMSEAPAESSDPPQRMAA